MTSIKTGLLSLVAVMALALVGPAAAAAAEWKHEGAPLGEHAEMSLEGSQIFTTEAGGMICEGHGTLTIEPGEKGEITSLEPTKCMGLFGELSGCTVIRTELLSNPQVDVRTEDLVATNATLRRIFNDACPVGQIEFTMGEMTMPVLTPTAIEEIEYFGTGEASIDGGEFGEYEEFGSWFVTPAGTYGIG
ncbi:MAG TPA: hypothetical protein VGV34_00765 [Solirubrobacterales bacterium]|nr:hypothetical protein [Solirubrobacterales bacterium]